MITTSSMGLGTTFLNIFKIEAGVPQDAVIALFLFNIYTADQLTTQNTIVANFADDKTLLVCHSDPDIVTSIKKPHLATSLIVHKMGPEIKPNKITPIYAPETVQCPQLFLNNQPLPYSQNLKYLGLTLER